MPCHAASVTQSMGQRAPLSGALLPASEKPKPPNATAMRPPPPSPQHPPHPTAPPPPTPHTHTLPTVERGVVHGQRAVGAHHVGGVVAVVLQGGAGAGAGQGAV